MIRSIRRSVVSCSLFILPTSVAHAAPWSASGAVARGDFDGDGNEERVVSSPESDSNQGAVFVVDDAAGTATRWTRNTSGLAGGGAAADDYFGAALTVGDFNDDGHDDLVIGAPGADDSGETDSGAIHVIYGSASGLTTTGDQVFHQDTTGIDGVAEDYDQVGEVLTVGDFNCDGDDDVVIGVPSEAVSTAAGAGATQVLYGSSSGISTVNDIYHQGAGGVDGVPEAGDHFGGAVAAGNFNGDESSGIGCDDLAVASPDEAVGSIASAGYVYTILGGASGLSSTGDLAWHQNSSGVVDTAELNDRFGLRLSTRDEDDDGYDDLFVVTPGDACQMGHGEGAHLFKGSSSGITLVGNQLLCHTYGCEIDSSSSVYACHTSSATIHASNGADDVYMLYADDVVHGGDGDDRFGGSHGDDVVFGGAGADTFMGGPGRDVYVGGSGNDTFVLGLDCYVSPGEVIDGGPGTDTVKSHLSRTELEGLGLTFHSVESVTTVAEGHGDCGEFAIEEGPWLKPRVALAWDDLPSNDSVHTTTASTLDLTIENLSDDAVSVDLTFSLTVRGFIVTYEPSTINVAASSSTGYQLDLDDFVPVGVVPQDVPEPWLDLPTSASLLARGTIRISSVAHGSASAPLVYGHLEDTGTTLVVYREDALDDTYYGGDLLAWRRGSTPPPSGSGRVFEAHLVASP